jgi:hypothetical protein
MLHPPVGHVIALMHGARERYAALDLRVALQVDLDVLRGRVVSLAEDLEPAGIVDADVRILVASRTRWRVELRSTERSFLQTRNEGTWWTSDPNGFSTGIASRTGVESPIDTVQPFEELWDPAMLIGEVWLDPTERVQVAGREGILVRAMPRPTTRPDGRDFILLDFPGGDEHELVVDADLGVVLRLRSLSAGREIVREEVRGLELDPVIPDGIFDGGTP